MSIKLNSVGGGSVTIQEPNTASDFTLSVPSRTGNVMVDGPAFSAFGNSSYSATSGVDTKVRFNNERFDTANCFDPTTNFRFTPNVAGYYQINYTVRFQIGSSFSIAYTMLYKNGSVYAIGNQIMNLGAGTVYMDMPASDLVYMNGTTDYLEVYVNIGATTITINDSVGTGFSSLFSGCLVRGA
jgi:hypothetical protein